MHIVFGGAFNGKREYVRNLLGNESVEWFESGLPARPFASSTRVIAGIDEWIKKQLAEGVSEEQILEKISQLLRHPEDGKLVWILTDISRGIVPVDPLERELRDVAGRVYQVLFSQAAEITRIWYGIPQNIKGGDGK
jgi:adenosyl cobinamide kinase/adenosyl cobinamide phosphate guanylyltransferase